MSEKGSCCDLPPSKQSKSLEKYARKTTKQIIIITELLTRYATDHISPRMKRLEKSELAVIYKDYKFFIIETEVKYGTD